MSDSTKDPSNTAAANSNAQTGALPPGNGVVQGDQNPADLNDLIDIDYVADPEGDRVDNNDAIRGPNPGSNDDIIKAGQGNDTVLAGEGNDDVYGEAGDDYLDGGTGDDTLRGGDGDDTLVGGSGQNFLEGGAGDDVFIGGEGADSFFGGEGHDIIDYSASAAPVNVNLDTNTLSGGDAGDDSIDGGSRIEGAIGSAGDDVLIGGEGHNDFYGGAGNDTLTGGAGDDYLDGGSDADYIHGLNGGDTVLGGSGNGPSGIDFDTMDLTGSVAATPGAVRFEVQDTVTDSDGNGIDGSVVYFDANDNQVGQIDFTNIEEIIPCFTPGTLIATPKGERLVETLETGDRVITRDNGIQEIRWVGHKVLEARDLHAAPHLQPVLIKSGALGNGLPERDMLVSPNHRVLVANDKTALYFEEREVLVAAKHLVDNEGIMQVEATATTYIHFMFDRHEVVLSDGAWTESFQPGDWSLKGLADAQRAEIFELFPELEHADGLADYPAARRTLKKHEAALLLK